MAAFDLGSIPIAWLLEGGVPFAPPEVLEVLPHGDSQLSSPGSKEVRLQITMPDWRGQEV